MKLTNTCIALTWCFQLLFLCEAEAQQQVIITGKAFEDTNNNGMYDKGEPVLQHIGISNGHSVVQTDAKGNYSIGLNTYQTLFAIKPSGYTTAKDVWNIPKNSLYFAKDSNNKLPKQFDFPFYKQAEAKAFKVAMLGDLQMRISEEVSYANQLLTTELSQRTDIAFNVMLGDIADDSLQILEETKQITKHYKWPTYGVFGNHDRELQNQDRKEFNRSFLQTFGASHYAFNYADVHFIAINDIIPQENGYATGVTQEQIDFIENDLKFVDEDKLVVLLQHVPLAYIHNKNDLLSILSKRKKLLAVSGHRHIIEQFDHKITAETTMHEVVAGAVCGLWWDGERDWNGIPHALMGCGAPKGYFIFSFDGNSYQMQYKAMEYPIEKQMHIWTWQPDRGDLGMQLPDGVGEQDILVNIYAASDSARVEMRINAGAWQVIDKAALPDPYATRIINYEAAGVYPTKNQIRSGLKKENSPHIWRGKIPAGLPAGSHKVEVRAQDRYGLAAYGLQFFTVASAAESH